MRLILFDCDGTLVDSQHMIFAAMNRAFGELGLPGRPRHAVLGIIGLSLPEAINRLVEDAERDAVPALCEGYRQAFGALRSGPSVPEPMFDGARDMILSLCEYDHVLLGIVTGKSQRGVRVFLDREQLHECFVTIQTADDAPSKPHPGMIERALSETGADAAQTVVIGDTTFDMRMARNAGVRGIGVDWGYHDGGALIEAGASALAEDFAQLSDLLGIGPAATEPAR